MSRGLDVIRERMTQYLQEQDIPAITAWPKEERLKREGAVVVVSLRKCQSGPAGFQDYLGELFNEETGRWEELYGKRIQLTFGLDLYARAEAGETAIQQGFDALAAALQQGGPEGLNIQGLSCGETDYDSAGRLLKRAVEAECAAYLYAVTEPGGAFLDFEIRGGIKL